MRAQGLALSHICSKILDYRLLRVDLERGDSYSDSRSHEDEVTLALMREAQRLHGPNAWASVRGGRYTAIAMGRPHEL